MKKLHLKSTFSNGARCGKPRTQGLLVLSAGHEHLATCAACRRPSTVRARSDYYAIGHDFEGNETREPVRTLRRVADLPGYWIVRFSDGGRLAVHEERLREAA